MTADGGLDHCSPQKEKERAETREGKERLAPRSVDAATASLPETYGFSATAKDSSPPLSLSCSPELNEVAGHSAPPVFGTWHAYARLE